MKCLSKKKKSNMADARHGKRAPGRSQDALTDNHIVSVFLKKSRKMYFICLWNSRVKMKGE